MIHIPFAQPNGRFSRANEERLAVARQLGSRSIGVMIAMVSLFGYPKFREILDEIMPYVEIKLPGLHFHLHKAYSLLLTIANVVSHHYQQALHVVPISIMPVYIQMCRLIPAAIHWPEVEVFFDDTKAVGSTMNTH